MSRAGRDARRRNRKIGTEDQGWKKATDFVIPQRWSDSRVYYEKLRGAVRVPIVVHRRELPVVVEPTREGFVHPCTPSDLETLLGLLPEGALFHDESIVAIVLRQPTRKQNALAPIWGRLVYYSELPWGLEGPAIYLEAQRPHATWRMERKLSVERQGELERMLRLAPFVELDKQGHHFAWGRHHLRRWMLYHTLIHEVGHWVDYLEKVCVPSLRVGEDGWDALFDRYRSRPRSEREAFAHRFSDEWRDELARAGELPFARKLDAAALRERGLDPACFGDPDEAADAAGEAIRTIFARPRPPKMPPPHEA